MPPSIPFPEYEASTMDPSSSTSPLVTNKLSDIQRLASARSRLVTLPVELSSSSRPPSPRSSSRSELLRERIIEAAIAANSDVTHPKWNHVTDLVRMACTSRGYKGAANGVRVGETNEVDVGDYNWVLPDTEDGWQHCERRWESRKGVRERMKEGLSNTRRVRTGSRHDSGQGMSPSKRDLVREKVESWKAKITQDADTDSMKSMPRASTSKHMNPGHSTKRPTPRDFPVTKRPSPTANSDKSGYKATSPTVPARAGMYMPIMASEHVQVSDQRPQQDKLVPGSIIDVPEMVSPVVVTRFQHPLTRHLKSFLPPSFPRDLQTSTPQIPLPSQARAERQKPPPIYPRPFLSSSPPSLHRSSSSAGRQPAASLPVPTSIQTARKRGRTLTPPSEDPFVYNPSRTPHANGPIPKRPRMGDPPHSGNDNVSSAPIPPSTPPPSTPPRHNSTSPPARELGNANGIPIQLTSPDRRGLPTLTELLASSRRSKPRPRPPSRKSRSVKSLSQHSHSDGVVHDRPTTPVDAHTPSHVRTYFSSPASGSSHSSPVERKGKPQSPVSPLFGHSLHMKEFVPPFVSTQQFHAPGTSLLGIGGDGPNGLSQNGQPVARGGSGIFGTGYNSQFDVEAQVGEVSALLERDVDFDNWLKDLSDENE